MGIKFSGPALNPGESVRIDVPALGVFHGTVRWHAGHRAGIALSDELDLSAVHFDNSHLTAKDNHKYRVATRFQPSSSTYRPGFGKRR